MCNRCCNGIIINYITIIYDVKFINNIVTTTKIILVTKIIIKTKQFHIYNYFLSIIINK